LDAAQIIATPSTMVAPSVSVMSAGSAVSSPSVEASDSPFGNLFGQHLLGLATGLGVSRTAMQAPEPQSPQGEVSAQLPKQVPVTDTSDGEEVEAVSLAVGQMAAVYAQFMLAQPQLVQQAQPGSAAAGVAEVPETNAVGGVDKSRAAAAETVAVPVLSTKQQNAEVLTEINTQTLQAAKNRTVEHIAEKPVLAQGEDTAVGKHAAVDSKPRSEQVLNQLVQFGEYGSETAAAVSETAQVNPEAAKVNPEATKVNPEATKVNPEATKVNELATRDASPGLLTNEAKTTSVVAPPQVRFAERPDIVQEAAESFQQPSDSDLGQAGSQARGQLAKLVARQDSSTLQDDVENASSVTQPNSLHHVTPLQGGQQHTQEVASVNVAEQAPAHGTQQVARQVAERLTSHDLKQGSDQISLKLSPEHLGNLQLNLRMDEQSLKLEIVAEHRSVRDALLQQADSLRETLAKQNIRMDSFDVSTGNYGSLPQQSQQWRQAESNQRQSLPLQVSSARSSAAVGAVEHQIRYFAPQYQSTLDARHKA